MIITESYHHLGSLICPTDSVGDDLKSRDLKSRFYSIWWSFDLDLCHFKRKSFWILTWL